MRNIKPLYQSSFSNSFWIASFLVNSSVSFQICRSPAQLFMNSAHLSFINSEFTFSISASRILLYFLVFFGSQLYTCLSFTHCSYIWSSCCFYFFLCFPHFDRIHRIQKSPPNTISVQHPTTDTNIEEDCQIRTRLGLLNRWPFWDGVENRTPTQSSQNERPN